MLEAPRHRLTAASCAVIIASTIATEAHAQQRVHAEITVGQSTGLTPYMRDVIDTQDSSEFDPNPDPDFAGTPLLQTYLADESNGWGSHIRARLRLGDYLIAASAQFHPRSQLVRHHKATTLESRSRLRPDGTFDDAGVEYTELEEKETVAAGQRNRGVLFVSSLQGGYSLEYNIEPFTLSVPFTAGLCMVNISEPAMPYAFGLRATTGLDGQYKLADNFAVTANFGLSALATMEYQNRQDAARRASLTGQGTSNALFSSLVQSWLEVGVVFIIR